MMMASPLDTLIPCADHNWQLLVPLLAPWECLPQSEVTHPCEAAITAVAAGASGGSWSRAPSAALRAANSKRTC